MTYIRHHFIMKFDEINSIFVVDNIALYDRFFTVPQTLISLSILLLFINKIVVARNQSGTLIIR